jgi:lipopolysaccharide export system permease protein
MKIINRYVLVQFFKYLMLCLAVLVFIYIIINLFDNLGKYLAKNALARDILIFYAYHIPSYIVLLIPVASIMAAFFVFGHMTKNRELIALKTSGLNINRLFVLLLGAGLIISSFTFAFQETVGVWAETKKFEHKEQKIDHRPQREHKRRRNFFYHGENNWVYFIRSYDSQIQQMDGVILWKITKQNTINQRIDAEYGIFKDSIWQFHNVVVRVFDTLGEESIAEHRDYALPELEEIPQDFLKRIKPLEEMNFIEISRFARKRKQAGEDVAEEEVELHYRFSYPLITIIVLLITLPLSVVLKKGGIAIGMGISIVIAFTYWGMIQSSRAYGVAGIFDPLIAAWLPNAIFASIGIVLMWKVPR